MYAHFPPNKKSQHSAKQAHTAVLDWQGLQLQLPGECSSFTCTPPVSTSVTVTGRGSGGPLVAPSLRLGFGFPCFPGFGFWVFGAHAPADHQFSAFFSPAVLLADLPHSTCALAYYITSIPYHAGGF